MNREQRQNIVKFALSTLGLYALYVVLALVVSYVLINGIVTSICASIFGEDTGLFLGYVLFTAFVPIITMLIIIPGKFNDKKAEREYVKSMEDKEYNVCTDMLAILKSPVLWLENIAYTICVLVLSARTTFASVLKTMEVGIIWALLIPIPIFYIVNLLLTSSLHRKWLSGRLHR